MTKPIPNKRQPFKHKPKCNNGYLQPAFEYLIKSEVTAKNNHLFQLTYLSSYDRYSYNPLVVNQLKGEDIHSSETNKSKSPHLHELIYKKKQTFGTDDEPISFERLHRFNPFDLIWNLSINPLRKVSTISLPKWKNLQDNNFRYMICYAALIRHGAFLPFTLTLGKEISNKALETPEGPAAFIRRQLMPRLKRTGLFNNSKPELMFTVEVSNKLTKELGTKVLHIHGAIAVPSLSKSQEDKLRRAFKKTASNTDIDEEHVLEFSSRHRYRMLSEKAESNGELGWATYSIKSTEYQMYISNNIIKAGHALYDAYLMRFKNTDSHYELYEGTQELLDWAKELCDQQDIDRIEKIAALRKYSAKEFSTKKSGIKVKPRSLQQLTNAVVTILKDHCDEEIVDLYRNNTDVLKNAILGYFAELCADEGRSIQVFTHKRASR